MNKKRIGIVYIPNDKFLDYKVKWLSQYGDVDIVLFKPGIDYDMYFDILVIDAIDKHHDRLSEVLVEQRFFEKILRDTKDLKLLAMNIAGLSLFEVLGGQTFEVKGHYSKSPQRIRRHGLLTKVKKGDPFQYTTMPSYHRQAMHAESIQTGDFISYSTSLRKKEAISQRYEACETGEIFLTESLGIIVGMPYMTYNQLGSRDREELNLERGCYPSDYLLRYLLKFPYDGPAPSNSTVTVPR